jgi:arsenate reductase
LFLCIGNSCRSQMAEGFARKYGSDVMEVASAGLAPASIVQSLTYKVMEEKNIKLDGHFPKPLERVDVPSFNIVVNMSGFPLPTMTKVDIRTWRVQDPIGQPEDVYVAVRDQLEMLVMRLILELRRTAEAEARSRSSSPVQRSSPRAK